MGKRVNISLLVIRLIVGAFWISQITWKLPPDFGCPDTGLCLWIQKEIEHPLIPFYATFLQNLVLPYAFFWGWFITILEIFIGASLILGFLARMNTLRHIL